MNDATEGPRPETLYLTNVGECVHGNDDCMLVYAVTKGLDGDKMNEADWFVTVYNNDGKVLEMPQPDSVTASTTYVVVFTLHLQTGMICPGYVNFNKNTVC